MDLKLKALSTSDLHSRIEKIIKENPDENNIEFLTTEIILPKNDGLFNECESEILYTELMKYQRRAQLALNNCRNKEYYRKCNPNKNTIQESDNTSYKENIGNSNNGKPSTEENLIDSISCYLILFNFLYHKEYKKLCKLCDSELPRDAVFCDICRTYVNNGETTVGKIRKFDEMSCMYCDGAIVDGKCTICDNSLFKNDQTNYDDSACNYKSIEVKERALSGIHTQDIIKCRVEGSSNNQSNDETNKEGKHQSMEEVEQTFNKKTNSLVISPSSSSKHTDIKSNKTDNCSSLNENRSYKHMHEKHEIKKMKIDSDAPTIVTNNTGELFCSLPTPNSRDHLSKPKESFGQDNINSSQNKKSTSYRNTQNETCKHRTKDRRGSTTLVEDGGNKGQTHSTSSEKSSDQPQFWICESCTFRNTNLSQLKCEICEIERRSINLDDKNNTRECFHSLPPSNSRDSLSKSKESFDQNNINSSQNKMSTSTRNTNEKIKHHSLREVEQTFDRKTNSFVFSPSSSSKHTTIKSNKTDNCSSLDEEKSSKHMHEKHENKNMKIDSEAPTIVTNNTGELFHSPPTSNSRDHLSKPKESVDQDDDNSSQNKMSTSTRNTNEKIKRRIQDRRGSTTLVEDGGNKDQTHTSRSDKFSDQSEFWICDNCTFRNTNLNSLNCEVCEKERRSINLEYKNKEDLSKNCKTENMNIINQNNSINYPIENKSNEKPKEISTGFKCYKCSYPNDAKCSDCRSLRIPDSKLGRSNETCVSDNEEILENKSRKRDTAENITKNTKTEDKWICNSCTFLNPLSTKMCEICMTINEGIDVGRDLEVPEETWICRQCDTSNSFDRYKCSNCKELADFFNKWVCERCRFFNDKLANKCGVCENKNPNIVKCSQCKEKLVEKNERCRDCLQKSLLLPMQTVREKTQKWEKVTSEKKEESVELMKETGGAKFTKIIKTDSVDFKEVKRCPNFLSCKGKVTNNNKWCKKCKENQWFCPNEDCGTINYLNKYCKKCKLQKDSDVSNCKQVTVLKDNKPAQMWMCGFCNKYSLWTYHRCSHCKNQRDSPSNTKCICGWNNAPRHNDCEKCGQIIKKK